MVFQRGLWPRNSMFVCQLLMPALIGKTIVSYAKAEDLEEERSGTDVVAQCLVQRKKVF